MIRNKVKIIASSVGKRCSCHINFRKPLQELNLGGKNFSLFVKKLHENFRLSIPSEIKVWKNLDEVVTYIEERLS
mgnify:CR=1 FL=1